MNRKDSAESFGGTASPEIRDISLHRVRLLDGFALLESDQRVDVPAQSERLIALLAVYRRMQSRRAIADRLWPETSEKRASANLRSALWHLNKRCPALVDTSTSRLALAENVEADLWRVGDWCDSIRAGQQPTLPIKLGPIDVGELLPSWGDEWLQIPRERHRLQWLQALEDFAQRRLERGDCVAAIETGRNIIAADPLRESAYYLLIASFLAQRNRATAIQCYAELRQVLAQELGVAPVRELSEFIAMR